MPHINIIFYDSTALGVPRHPYYWGFEITLGRTPLDGWSAHRRYLYLTTHNTHKTQTSMPLAGFDPTIPASEPPQTHALRCTTTGIGITLSFFLSFFSFFLDGTTVQCRPSSPQWTSPNQLCFWPLSPICNCGYINIRLYTVPSPVFLVALLVEFPEDYCYNLDFLLFYYSFY